MMTSPPSILEFENLTVAFNGVRAIDSLSFRLGYGNTLGLLGSNGAGKTTTISVALGLIAPAAGRITVLGADMTNDRYAVLHRINYSSPYSALPARLTVAQILRFYGHLYGVASARQRIRRLAGELDISGLLNQPFGVLSAGQKTRVSLAKALINTPELLLLDEPTASLDPDTADWIRSLLEQYREQTGCSILIASHNMGEVERLCSDIVILGGGRIVDSGTPSGLMQRYDRTNFESVFLDIVRGGARVIR